MKIKYEDILEFIKMRREKILSGGVNCIPSDFERFSNDYVGIEQGTFYCITANTKVGKSQIANYMFVYNPLLYMLNNPDKVNVVIYYYNLEEAGRDLVIRMLSNMLHRFSEGKIRQNSKFLKSTKTAYPLDIRVLNLMETDSYKSLMNFILDKIDFREERTVEAIYKSMERFCLNNGHWKMRSPGPGDDPFGGEIREKFIWDNPDTYFICIFDHLANLDAASGDTMKTTIDKLCKKCVELRNDYGIIPVAVMQQAMAQESLENIKAKKLRPSTAGLGDSKTAARDFNVMLGLFDPFRHEMQEYMGYDIQKMRNHIRFLEMVLNRDGESGSMVPLFFDGDTNTFKEMPKVWLDADQTQKNPELEEFYRKVEEEYINRRPEQAIINLCYAKRKKKKLFKKKFKKF